MKSLKIPGLSSNVFRFSSITLVPLIFSLVTLPSIIEVSGIRIWQSVMVGQTLGMMIGEIVDSGWSQQGPRIFANFGNVQRVFKTSFRLRLKKFFLIMPLAVISIAFFEKLHPEIVMLSCFLWALNGLNGQWMTIATGNPRHVFRYTVLPRISSVLLALPFLYLSRSIHLFLLIQIIGAVLGLYRLILSVSNEYLESDQVNQLLKNMRKSKFLPHIGFIKSSGVWLPVLLASLFFLNEMTWYFAILKYVEFAWALASILPQSQHSQIASRNSPSYRLKSHFTSVFFAFLVSCSFITLWPLAESYLFRNQIQIPMQEVILIVLSVPLRALVLTINQDFFMLSGRHSISAITYLSNSILISALPMIAFSFTRSNLSTAVSYLAGYSFTSIILILSIKNRLDSIKVKLVLAQVDLAYMLSYLLKTLLFRKERTRETVLVISPFMGKNIGDVAMIESLIGILDKSKKVNLIVGGFETGNIEAIVKDDKREIFHLDAIVHPGKFTFLGDCLSVLRKTLTSHEVYLIGADCLDGGYNPLISALVWRLLKRIKQICPETRVCVVGFSWNASRIELVEKNARSAVNSGVEVFIRDPKSNERFIKNISADCVLTGDLVFSLTENPEIPLPEALIRFLAGNKFVLINMSGYIATKVDLFQYYREVLELFLEKGYKIVLTPHAFVKGSSDLDVLRRLAFEYANKSGVFLIDTQLSPYEINNIARGSSFFVTGRMHLAILCLKNLVPGVIFRTQGKTEGLKSNFPMLLHELDLSETKRDLLTQTRSHFINTFQANWSKDLVSKMQDLNLRILGRTK